MTSLLSLFPQELLDSVIDCLDDDRQAMKACSLVCRAFRPHAVTRLFYELDLKKTLYSPARWTKFHEICLASPHIPRTFRKLRLSLFYIDHGGGKAVPVLRMLSNIEILIVGVTAPRNLSPYLKSALVRMPIVSVTIEVMHITSKVELFKFLNECTPGAKTLTLDNVTCSPELENFQPMIRACPLEKIEVLCVRPISQLLDAVADECLGTLDALHTLKLGLQWHGDPAFGRLIDVQSVRSVNLAPKRCKSIYVCLNRQAVH